MRKIFYFNLLVFILFASKSEAQYHLTTTSLVPQSDSGHSCSYPQFIVNTNAYTSGLTIKTYYGDGTSSTSTVNNGGSYGYANCYSAYSFPGTYTLKHVLYNGAIAIDSMKKTYEHLYCNSYIIKCFYDSLGTGIYSASDQFMNIPLNIQVSKNGIIIDTISIISGSYYWITGYVGDIYAFKMVSIPPGLNVTSPASGIIYDTVTSISNNYSTKYFGLQCTSTTQFDLAVNACIPVTGIHDQWGNIYVTNSSCEPQNAVVTLNFSPKYNIHSGWIRPTPVSASGNTITWNLTGISSKNEPLDLYYAVFDDAGLLAAGDTVQEHISITPITGDLNPANNVELIIDTVRAGCDPNAMWVSPVGNITTGTQLQYSISFVNTGNDTAFNISVYDTLSDNVDVKSLHMVMASAPMNMAILNQDGHNIVKFDFPNINLLDSSNHGLCNGAVVFTVKSLNGLPVGTTIFNHAGIFFDYNPVVMTDTVENIIGIPSGVNNLSQISKVTLFPNPATDELIIKCETRIYNELTITNTVGQSVITQPIFATQTNINVHELPTGVYYITLRGDGGIKVQQFVKL